MQVRIGKFIVGNLRKPIFWFAVSAFVIACIVNVSPARTSDDALPKDSIAARTSRGPQVQREGAKIQKIFGTFRQSNGRMFFAPKADPKSSYCCLENLMLQRIETSLADQSAATDWKITGDLTEFHEANYLLIRSAERAE